MSSTVNMDLVLISSSNILPKSRLEEVFKDCVEELGGRLFNNCLELNNEYLGKVTINNRIVLSFATDYENSKRAKARELLRKTFTRRVSVAHENYLFELSKEKERLEKESLVKKELLKSIKTIEESIKKSEIGFERQQMDECEAMKNEIVDAAIAQGYEVVEEKTNEGTQLQFIRREY